ncbi:hypothetical protein [Bythopirellula goksoeyrii]|uniref:Uncharacterized protein n=1 Tax=Bythopirellula goksoeyrii TaxID=1400387 RepID=A0A5B9Q2L5_9BACT|nr:hypothetical protein [Bythopirellula goksoeyrii]QEG33258.1 hypothetical protein Pr1d_05190 [Bythopirellula goksoeyrii]
MPEKLPSDITQRVIDDFGHEHATRILQHLLDKIPDGLANGTRHRHLRCILYLSEGDEVRLDEYIEMCLQDTRDVMLNAEYEGKGLVRKRDFDRPFGRANLE